MSDARRRRTPEPLGAILDTFLRESGLGERVEQAGLIPEWPGLVGPQIAAVTEPRLITADGTLFVSVTTNAWMTELSLMEPELLRTINAQPGRLPIRKR